MQRKQSSRCSGVAHFLVCLAVAAVFAGSDAAAQDQPAPGRSIKELGYVEAFEQVNVYARITGYVKKVTVDLGDRVKKGDVLAELWEPEMEQQLKHKEALVVKARAGIARAKLTAKVLAAALACAKAAVKEAEIGRLKSAADLERWKAQYERAKKLSKQGVFDQATLDETVHQWKAAEAVVQQAAAKIKSAEAMLDEAIAQREAADADIDIAEAGLAVANAEAAQVSALIQYAVLRAPFDGVVIRRNVYQGALVRPPTDGKAEPLCTVAHLDRVRIALQVPEDDAVLVVKGMPATLRFPALKGQEFKGTVARTGWALDPKTRTMRVEIDLENPDGRLRPGMYAYVVLKAKT